MKRDPTIIEQTSKLIKLHILLSALSGVLGALLFGAGLAINSGPLGIAGVIIIAIAMVWLVAAKLAQFWHHG